MFLFWRAVNLQMNRTVKYQGAFSRIVGFAGKRFLFSPSPPRSTFFFFCSRSNFRAITRLETLATQAMLWEKSLLITLAWQTTSRNYTVTLLLYAWLFYYHLSSFSWTPPSYPAPMERKKPFTLNCVNLVNDVHWGVSRATVAIDF